MQLNEVATGSHILTEHYDRGLADLFAEQDEITEAVVATIEPQLYAMESIRAQRKPVWMIDDDVRAYRRPPACMESIQLSA